MAQPSNAQKLAVLSVLEERARQDEKWGDQSGQPPMVWVAILTEEVGEVAQEALRNSFAGKSLADYRTEMVQVAAVALAAVEAVDRNA